MANNYYDATGVLVFNGERIVTPVIRALFGAFKLQTSYPGGNEAYIARLSEGGSTRWSTILENLQDAAPDLGIHLAEDADELDALTWLQTLAEKFNCVNGPFASLAGVIVAEANDDQDADLGLLYDLAMFLQDGHNLVAIKMEGSWRCDDPRLFEFGGNGQYIGKHFVLAGTSGETILLGESMDAALGANDVEQAAKVVLDAVQRQLNGITNHDHRRSVTAHVVGMLVAA